MLTLGQGVYEKHVQLLRRVYATLHNTGKQYERACQELRTKQEAVDCGLRCIEVRLMRGWMSGRRGVRRALVVHLQELKKVVDSNAETLRAAANMAKVIAVSKRASVECC